MNLFGKIDTNLLKREYGINKVIPEKYEKVILPALAHYPDLLNTHITFKIAKDEYHFLRTKARTTGLLLKRGKRRYEVKILEPRRRNYRGVVFKQLTPEAQIGAIARELSLIELCNTSKRTKLVRNVLHSVHNKGNRPIEFTVDHSVIRHGLSMQLLDYSKQVRSLRTRTFFHKPRLTSQAITLLRNQQLGL